MISPSRFELIRKKHGQYASWAIWADEGTNPKDNIGDLTIFNDENQKALLRQLNPNNPLKEQFDTRFRHSLMSNR